MRINHLQGFASIALHQHVREIVAASTIFQAYMHKAMTLNSAETPCAHLQTQSDPPMHDESESLISSPYWHLHQT